MIRGKNARGQWRIRTSAKRTVPAVVIVDDEPIPARVAAKPLVGSELDVGFLVVVVQAKDVAGGGVIVAAERLDSS